LKTAIAASSDTQSDAGVISGHPRAAAQGLSRPSSSPTSTRWPLPPTPADWRQGDRVIVAPALSDEEAHKLFPGGFETKKPYLRLTADPSK
jgi:hypothetical protein